MKFTNEYIEMVSKAEEIQGLWKINEGNWFVYNGTNGKYEKLNPFCSTFANEIKPYMREYYSWLPTLDDLFGMVEGDVIDKLDSFYDWVVVDCTNVILLNNLVDMKEFLLCYVMFDKFNKHWHPDKHQWEAIK